MAIWWAGYSAEERFWMRVQKSDGCWEWQGPRDKDGYGRMRQDKQEGEKKGRVTRVPRYAWALYHGAIPSGMDVLHTCDNPPCVRPDHLYLGNQADNSRDMRERNRTPGRRLTHCSKGHEFTPDNTIWRPNKTRACRTCHNGRRRRSERQIHQLEV